MTQKSVTAQFESAKRRSAGQRYLDSFGSIGGRWFAEGKTFAQAQALFDSNPNFAAARHQERVKAIEADGVLSPGMARFAASNTLSKKTKRPFSPSR